jgi:hypothetical protein
MNAMENQGLINVYTCETCKGEMVTINKDSGVTPFVLRCRSCNGEAVSGFYRGAQDRKPEYEFYRPNKITGSPQQREHLKLGGLLFRQIGEAKAEKALKMHRNAQCKCGSGKKSKRCCGK